MRTPTIGQKKKLFDWLRAIALDGKNEHNVQAIVALQILASPIGAIDAERSRQIQVEGFDHGHDDDHDAGELAAAAAAYALNASCVLYPHNGTALDAPPAFWMWDSQWWKPKDARRDLIRAGALIVAELEKLDRAEKKG